MSSSYVDMMGYVRWTEQAHIERDNAETRSLLLHVREHVLDRRLTSLQAKALSLLMPPAPVGSADPFVDVRGIINFIAAHFTPLTAAAQQELAQAASVLSNADASASQARADAALLGDALDYEGWRAQQAGLPPMPVADPVTGIVPPDTLTPDQRTAVEAQRSALQAQMNAASVSTTNLVAQRDAYRLANGTSIPGQVTS